MWRRRFRLAITNRKRTRRTALSAAGVSRATIYLRFGDKKQIGLASADRTHFSLLEALRAIAKRVAQGWASPLPASWPPRSADN